MKKALFSSFKISFIFSLVFYSMFARADELKAGVINLTPFGFKETNTGIYYEMIRAIEKNSGVKVNVAFLPYARMPVALKDAEIDFSIFLATKDSLENADCITPVYNYSMQVIPNSKFKVNKYEDLYKLPSIAFTRGITLSKEFDADDKMKKTIVTDYKNAFEMFNIGRVSAVAGTSIGLRYNIIVNNVKAEDMSKPFELSQTHACFLISKNTKKRSLIESKIVPVVNTMVKAKEFDKIVDGFFEKMKKK